MTVGSLGLLLKDLATILTPPTSDENVILKFTKNENTKYNFSKFFRDP